VADTEASTHTPSGGAEHAADDERIHSARQEVAPERDEDDAAEERGVERGQHDGVQGRDHEREKGEGHQADAEPASPCTKLAAATMAAPAARAKVTSAP
jgi:hypothetical protein